MREGCEKLKNAGVEMELEDKEKGDVMEGGPTFAGPFSIGVIASLAGSI